MSTITRRFGVLLSLAGAAVLVSPTSAQAAGTLASPAPTTPYAMSMVSPLAARGSVPVGTASYPIPSGAIFVDPVRGNDGAAGTQSSPVKTVRGALDRVRSGGTIVLRAGSYHERVFVGSPVTIQNYPGEAAWFDGSTVARTWTKTGAQWITPYTLKLDHSWPGGSDTFLTAEVPLAAHPDMVFVDGVRQEQVSGAPAPGQFSVDTASGKLKLGSDPTGREVRYSDLQQALVVGSPDVTIQGIGVRRYANSVSTYGALFLARQRDVIRNVVVEDVATTGISFTSDYTNGAGVAENVTVQRAGMLGIHGNKADGLVIKNSVVRAANYERFNTRPTSAGIKIGQSRRINVDNNEVSGAYRATGIWLDESVVGFEVTRNLVQNNGEGGIDAELSSSGLIASNTVVGHEYGIFLTGTEDTIVSNNTVGYNSGADLQLVQDWRRQSQPNTMGHDSRYSPGDPTNTWILRNITIRNNALAPEGNQKSGFQIYVMDRNTNRSADVMNIQIEGNAFSPKVDANSAIAIGWGNGDNVTKRDFDTPEAWAKATGRTSKNYVTKSTDFGQAVEEARFHSFALPIGATLATKLGAAATVAMIGSFTC